MVHGVLGHRICWHAAYHHLFKCLERVVHERRNRCCMCAAAGDGRMFRMDGLSGVVHRSAGRGRGIKIVRRGRRLYRFGRLKMFSRARRDVVRPLLELELAALIMESVLDQVEVTEELNKDHWLCCQTVGEVVSSGALWHHVECCRWSQRRSRAHCIGHAGWRWRGTATSWRWSSTPRCGPGATSRIPGENGRELRVTVLSIRAASSLWRCVVDVLQAV